MPWPTVPVVTTNLDANADSPLSARSDILDLTTKFNDLIVMRGVANGVASLDGTGKVPLAQMPAYRGASVTASGVQSLTGPNIVNTLLFDLEQYDTDSIHSLVSDTGRLVVPSGVSKIKLSGQVSTNLAASITFATAIWKNNGPSGIPTRLLASGVSANPQENSVQIHSPVLSVTPGDYYTLVFYHSSSSAQGTVANHCYFAMEIIE